MKSDKIGILIKKASLEFDTIANPLLAFYGLTPAQFKILRFLSEKKSQAVRQVDIEHYFSMRNPTVTGILQNMEKSGWILRKTNPEDGRSKVISLAQKALDEEARLDEMWEALESRFIKNLSEEEQTQLICLLNKMLET